MAIQPIPRSAAPKGRPHRAGVRRVSERRVTCLLTTLHSERALSLALAKHLVEELPDIDFTLDHGVDVDVVWVCGYERGAYGLVRSLHLLHPRAVLVVTGKEPEESWAPEVLAAGADYALTWPLLFPKLNQVLHRRVLERRA